MIVGWSSLGGALFMLFTLNVFTEPLLGFAIGSLLTYVGLGLFSVAARRAG